MTVCVTGFAFRSRAEHRAAAEESKLPSRGNLSVWIPALAGRTAEARRLLEQVPAEQMVMPLFSYSNAAILGELGETDRAFALLEQAYQGRTALMSVLKVDPRMDALRDDPRFEDLLRRMNFPQ